MKKVTLALVLLVSLSFTAMQTNEYAVSNSENPFNKIEKDSIKGDTLATEEANNFENLEKKKIVNLSSKGLVSWYGGKFHGRKTASGAKYNMNELTAAHKTLPFGTQVKMINPRNGKEVIVKITDRGPFIPKREFDLSKAAFAELTNLDSGILNVTYEIL